MADLFGRSFGQSGLRPTASPHGALQASPKVLQALITGFQVPCRAVESRICLVRRRDCRTPVLWLDAERGIATEYLRGQRDRFRRLGRSETPCTFRDGLDLRGLQRFSPCVGRAWSVPPGGRSAPVHAETQVFELEVHPMILSAASSLPFIGCGTAGLTT